MNGDEVLSTYDPEKDPGRSSETNRARPEPPERTTSALGRTALGAVVQEHTGASKALGKIAVTNVMNQGGLVSISLIKAQLRELERQSKDQITVIETFLKANRDNMELVRTSLEGSSKNYDQLMISSLLESEQALIRSRDSLSQAIEAIHRVEQI